MEQGLWPSWKELFSGKAREVRQSEAVPGKSSGVRSAPGAAVRPCRFPFGTPNETNKVPNGPTGRNQFPHKLTFVRRSVTLLTG